MRLLRSTATDEDVVNLCRDWVELVAADRIDEALDLLWTPPDYDESQRWTPDALRRYIENYGSWDPTPDGSKWRITSIATVGGPTRATGPRVDVVRLQADERAGSVDFDVPLNGKPSDLTAQFEFRAVNDGIAVSLYDLHVR